MDHFDYNKEQLMKECMDSEGNNDLEIDCLEIESQTESIKKQMEKMRVTLSNLIKIDTAEEGCMQFDNRENIIMSNNPTFPQCKPSDWKDAVAAAKEDILRQKR